MAVEFLGLDEVLEIHRDQVARYGGKPGLRDLGLLEAALAVPQVGARGRYFHGDLFAMAAAYLFHIARDHPFVDGNKRTAAAAALVFLELNGRSVHMPNVRLYESVMAVAGGTLSKDEMAERLRLRGRR